MELNLGKRDFRRVVTVLADNIMRHEMFLAAYPDAPKQVRKSAESRMALSQAVLAKMTDNPEVVMQARRDAHEKDINAPWRKRLEKKYAVTGTPQVWRYKIVCEVDGGSKKKRRAKK